MASWFEDVLGAPASDFTDLGSSAFRWMGERDRAKAEANWRAIQATQAADIARAYGAASVAQTAITQAQSNRTFTALLVVGMILILFRIRPTAND
jgi:hypothetical protein